MRRRRNPEGVGAEYWRFKTALDPSGLESVSMWTVKADLPPGPTLADTWTLAKEVREHAPNLYAPPPKDTLRGWDLDDWKGEMRRLQYLPPARRRANLQVLRRQQVWVLPLRGAIVLGELLRLLKEEKIPYRVTRKGLHKANRKLVEIYKERYCKGKKSSQNAYPSAKGWVQITSQKDYREVSQIMGNCLWWAYWCDDEEGTKPELIYFHSRLGLLVAFDAEEQRYDEIEGSNRRQQEDFSASQRQAVAELQEDIAEMVKTGEIKTGPAARKNPRRRRRMARTRKNPRWLRVGPNNDPVSKVKVRLKGTPIYLSAVLGFFDPGAYDPPLYDVALILPIRTSGREPSETEYTDHTAFLHPSELPAPIPGFTKRLQAHWGPDRGNRSTRLTPAELEELVEAVGGMPKEPPRSVPLERIPGYDSGRWRPHMGYDRKALKARFRKNPRKTWAEKFNVSVEGLPSRQQESIEAYLRGYDAWLTAQDVALSELKTLDAYRRSPSSWQRARVGEQEAAFRAASAKADRAMAAYSAVGKRMTPEARSRLVVRATATAAYNPSKDPRMPPLPKKFRGEDVYDPREESIRAVARGTGGMWGVGVGTYAKSRDVGEVIQRSWERYQDPDKVIRDRQEYELMLGENRASGPYRITYEPTRAGLRYFVWPLSKGQRVPVGWERSRWEADYHIQQLYNHEHRPAKTLPPKRYTKAELADWLPPDEIWKGRSRRATKAAVKARQRKPSSRASREGPVVNRSLLDAYRAYSSDWYLDARLMAGFKKGEPPPRR